MHVWLSLLDLLFQKLLISLGMLSEVFELSLMVLLFKESVYWTKYGVLALVAHKTIIFHLLQIQLIVPRLKNSFRAAKVMWLVSRVWPLLYRVFSSFVWVFRLFWFLLCYLHVFVVFFVRILVFVLSVLWLHFVILMDLYLLGAFFCNFWVNV